MSEPQNEPIGEGPMKEHIEIEQPVVVEADEVTSPETASKAAAILKDPDASDDVKSVAASALKQTANKKPKAKK